MKGLSSWEFDDKISDIFDNHVIQSVPSYEQIQNIVSHISDFFIEKNGVVYDLGCSTGETIQRINMRHFEKKINFIGIDNSKAMIDKAKEKNKFYDNIKFENNSISNYDFESDTNLVISILTLQFLNIEQREQVIKNIYNSLSKGGAFLFVEKVYSSYSQTQDIYTQIYHDYKEEHGLLPDDIRNKDKSLRGVLVPLSLEDNIKMLEKLNFKVEVFFKYLNFTGFLAIK